MIVVKVHAHAIGCLNPRSRTHGEYVDRKASKEFEAWNQARWRCENPKHHAYRYYGGRGIEVRCTFAELLADIGRCPPGLSLDRIDTRGHYEVGNLRWATWKEQGLNRRVARHWTLNDQRISLRDMASHLAINREVLGKKLRGADVTLV